MENMEISYDRFGRMFYNSEFHENNRKPWDKEDMDYLIQWYDRIGPEEMSFALGRTMKTVQTKVSELRKKGVMKKPAKQIRHKRIKKEMA